MTKEELKKEFEKYLKNSSDYYDPREPLTERKLLQMWLDCAEPREKQIAELEHQLTHRNCLDCSNHSSKLRMRNLELEKENAELKETLRTYNGCGDWDNDFHTCRVYLQREELQKCVEHLTKAKELLERLLITSCNSDVLNLLPNCSEVLRVRVEAEQFLNEVKKCGQ